MSIMTHIENHRGVNQGTASQHSESHRATCGRGATEAYSEPLQILHRKEGESMHVHCLSQIIDLLSMLSHAILS